MINCGKAVRVKGSKNSGHISANRCNSTN